jgi:Calpain family cysteine protease/RTX calcium-binding nonapeptide repeat (4 copies)
MFDSSVIEESVNSIVSNSDLVASNLFMASNSRNLLHCGSSNQALTPINITSLDLDAPLSKGVVLPTRIDNYNALSPVEYRAFNTNTLSTEDSYIDKLTGRVLQEAKLEMTDFIEASDFIPKLELAFGNNIDLEKLQKLVTDFTALPPIKIVSDRLINNAQGAYDSLNRTIYLSREYLTKNANNVEAIAKVLVEEIGHYLDSQISPVDSPGDEGQIFSALVYGTKLSESELVALKNENDKVTVKIDGNTVQIEQASLKGTSRSDTIYGGYENNIIDGGDGNDFLYSQHGDDLLIGGNGNDFLDGGFGFDTLNGGSGVDTANFQFFNGGLIADLQINRVIFSGSTRREILIEIENLIGSSGSDRLIGNGSNNALDGGNGSDVLTAYGFNRRERDILTGGANRDSFILGDAKDVYYAKNGAVDVAVITDFNVRKDVIQLKNRASDYRLVTVDGNTEIRLANNRETIAIVRGVTGLNLNSRAFTFIQAAPTPTLQWFRDNLKDAGLINQAARLLGDGQFSRNDAIAIFRNAGDGRIISADELRDLRTLVANASTFNAPDFVRVLADKVVNGNVANQRYQGGFLGNLVAFSSADRMEKLIGKWFLGSDRPMTNSSYDTYREATGTLFQNGISANDVKQGVLRNCYFLATLSSIAQEKPSYIQDMFIDNGDRTFSVRFFNRGVADYVTVDRFLPVDTSGRLIYAGVGGDVANSSTELWVALAEKAYAQLAESGWSRQGTNATNAYSAIEGGWMFPVMRQLTALSTTESCALSMTKQQLVDLCNSNRVLTAGFSYGEKYGVVNNHAYAIASYDVSTDTFYLRNPWGAGDVNLNWAQLSELQTQIQWTDV